ncbi:MAG: endopeptidase La [FCB group bacterium]|jgi:ATP-dependent Lon protease|nr:endopeptidase La [FCB group bacterium]
MNEDQSKAEAAVLTSNEQYPAVLPLLTVQDQVIFPLSLAPLRITDKTEMKLIEEAAMGDKFLALITRRNTELPASLENAYDVGCIGRILQLQRTPDGNMHVAIQALKRFRVVGVESTDPYPRIRVEVLDDSPLDGTDAAPLVMTLKLQMGRLIDLSPNLPDNAATVIENIQDAGFLADLAAANLNINIEEKQKLLETLDRKARLERIIYLVTAEVDLLELSKKIQTNVKSTIDRSQREYFLRQQMRAIQEELGEAGSERPELKAYLEKIEASGMPEDVRKEAMRDLDRLGQMNEASSEYHVITTYLDWLVDLPWAVSTEDHIDLSEAERILNEDHYGLEKVKRRILEYLAVRKLKADAGGPILCFLGPPGVGKTSLGQSIARAMGRKFVRISLGGMRDEAEIRGHRRTYIGALPGRIIQSMRKVGVNNPIFMLDEIDKVGSDWRGDPSSALLEVLDPAQNGTFTDHYLNVPFDLSKVMFIGTANSADTIPWALRDRMEIIDIAGYTVEEKLKIASKYLVPRQIEANGLPPRRVSFSTPALRRIITGYTREAGVRNLERQIGTVCRGIARQVADNGRAKQFKVTPDDLAPYLGRERVFHDVAERTSIPGVATGLAWTPTGGDILFIEATRMPGKGSLVLTGQLGEVMKESAQAVLSYVRSNAAALNIPEETFTQNDLHIHIPAGAVQKDGPSAGVAMLAAVTSLLSGKRIRSNVAMTGEITLRGLVLPVGGIKEKVLAAHSAGIREVILPERNEPDLDDVPASARDKMKFHPVQRMSEALKIALGIEM